MDPNSSSSSQGGFGFSAVFLTSLCTILGAILFLRFGYAVANVGLLGTLGIVVLGHLVTVPTAMAVSEIATNRRVEGGGAYYIISRSFGINIGAATGIALYFSQAISIAFYVIAFGEAFEPVLYWVRETYGYVVPKQAISIPSMGLLTLLMLTRGADAGMKALYGVAVILGFSLVLFYAGGTDYVPPPEVWSDQVAGGDDFFMVFAICFPAFTGMAAGLGMSGDLKDPKTAIPAGTMLATVAGMLIYSTVAVKLAYSASPEALNADQLFMSRVAVWGPIIPIGLAAASLSSALGSIMVAPRTLQALANDHVFQSGRMNTWLSKTKNGGTEPVNAALITAAIGFFFIALGELDLVAQIITMFFMVTYGAICLISFLEHFAADPAYRPSFKSHWALSLLGFLFSVYLMFRISLGFTILSAVLLVLMYLSVTWKRKDRHGMAAIFQGVSFQLSRGLQVFLQKANREEEETWRPSIVCVSRNTFKRFSAFEMTTWLSHRYGFGTYTHMLDGYLSPQTRKDASEALGKLLDLARNSRSNVFCNTLISPSFTTAVAQIMQLPGVSGKDNNMILFEFSKHEPDGLEDLVGNHRLVKSANFDLVLLRSSEKGFGLRHEIHVWISDQDYQNANLMILLAYIVLGHPDWKNATIKLFAIFPEAQQDSARANLQKLVVSGRLPITAKNIEVIVRQQDLPRKAIINGRSREADLTFIGFRDEALRKNGMEIFDGYEELGNVLFVSAAAEKEIQLLS